MDFAKLFSGDGLTFKGSFPGLVRLSRYEMAVRLSPAIPLIGPLLRLVLQFLVFFSFVLGSADSCSETRNDGSLVTFLFALDVRVVLSFLRLLVVRGRKTHFAHHRAGGSLLFSHTSSPR